MAYNPDQPRDGDGKWASGGASGQKLRTTLQKLSGARVRDAAEFAFDRDVRQAMRTGRMHEDLRINDSALAAIGKIGGFNRIRDAKPTPELKKMFVEKFTDHALRRDAKMYVKSALGRAKGNNPLPGDEKIRNVRDAIRAARAHLASVKPRG